MRDERILRWTAAGLMTDATCFVLEMFVAPGPSA
jgi:hypothetical protein